MSLRAAAAIPLGYALLLAAGDAVRSRLGRRLPWGLERLGLAFAFGVGALTWLLFIATTIAPGVASAPTVVALALAIAATRRRASREKPGLAPTSTPWSWAPVAVVAVLGAANAIAAFGSDWEIDGEVIWAHKARLAVAAGGLPPGAVSDLSRQWAHLDYPWLLPLGEAAFGLLAGEPSPLVFKAILPGFFTALLALFATAVEREHGPRLAAFATALLGVTPALFGLATTGHADVALALFVLGAASGLFRWAQESGRASDLRQAAVFAGLAAWTKNEGLVWLLGSATFVAVAAKPPRVRHVALATLAAATALIAGPWLIMTMTHHVPRNDFVAVTPSNLVARSERIAEIARWTGRELTLRPWACLWPIVALSLVNLWGDERRARLALLLGALVPLAVLLASYVFGRLPLVLHLAWSLERVLVPGAVVLALFATTQLARAFEPARRRGG